MHTDERIIEESFAARDALSIDALRAQAGDAVEHALQGLEAGTLRVAEPDGAGGWRVNQWLKKAVLLHFRLSGNRVMPGSPSPYYDKVALRYEGHDEAAFRSGGARDVVLMPSFVNIGAYVGQGTMVDTWATVGSCAQIGAHVHLSGGAGIGGVLEPLQANPTIIEDGCFVGARSEVVEGVVVERGSVIGMGVFLGQSTRIYDRATKTVTYGRVPAGSVVVAGSLPAADGSHSLYCAVIVKQVDEKTRAKTSINELLRGHD
jgi:2,3,4,5-tetrahydropyridine-2-carboxylate N-succinyltransferase